LAELSTFVTFLMVFYAAVSVPNCVMYFVCYLMALPIAKVMWHAQ